MKNTTLKNRLEKNYKGSKTSKAYQIISEILGSDKKTYMVFGRIIRPCHTSGTGRFTSNLDYTKDVIDLLDLLKVKYEVGNDSPRGGLTGNFIKIISKIS